MIIKQVDIEDAIRKDVESVGKANGYTIATCAPPLSADFGKHLPFAYFMQTGGSRKDLVIDNLNITIDVYDKTWAAVRESASVVEAIIASFPYTADTSIQYHAVDIAASPYPFIDPDHPTIPRMRFTVSVTVKGYPSSNATMEV